MAADEIDTGQTLVGVPMNVYEYLDDGTRAALDEHLEEDADLSAFQEWLARRIEAGTMRQIVAEHIVRWNQLKATTSEHVREYEVYTRGRLNEWKPLGLNPPSGSMFGAHQPVVSAKQPRNAPCWCGTGLKFKRCHGAPAAAQ